MAKKTDFRLILYVIIGLADEALILVALLLVLSWLGVEMPLWLIVSLSLVLLALTFPIYRAFKREPLLGFDNMVGKKGIVVSPLAPKGTIKIGNELWSAEIDDDKAGNGSEVAVVGQTGLKLTVSLQNKNDE